MPWNLPRNPPGTCLKPPGTSPGTFPEHCWGKKHKPRCYPQQGNSASKENLRQRLFPILGEVSWYFEIFAVTTSEIQGRRLRLSRRGNLVRNLNFPKPFQNLNQNLPNWRDTAQNILHDLDGQHQARYAQDCTYHLSTATGSPREPSQNPVFSTFLPGPPRGTSSEPCPGTCGTGTSLIRTCPRNLPGTLFRNLPRNLPGTCPGTFPEPAPEPSRNLPRDLPGTRGSEAA